MAQSASHLKALLLKNWILFKRSPFTSCCEMLIPILLVILLVLMRSLISIDDKAETSYIANSTNFSANPVIPPQIYNIITNLPNGSISQILALDMLYGSFHLKYSVLHFFFL